MDDLSQFKPLRMIINGQGGSGKSVVINTIVSVMRQMFDDNDVVKVVAPTGVAAYNVNGETFHHCFNMGVNKGEYKANTMTAHARKKLVKKFKTLLALIVDERSLVPTKILGQAETMLAETIFEGGHFRDETWGGIPIIIIAGDDYQLPGIGEGGIEVLYRKGGSKMVQKGRTALLECASFVADLSTSKRMKSSETANRELMGRLRVGNDIRESDVQKLMSLHLDNIQATHGTAVVNDIRDKAMFLYYRNQKRQQHNMRELVKRSSPTNPVAIVKSKSSGQTNSKGVSAHFEGEIPTSALLCQDCKVALNNRNFYPAWGLHNGACGTVDEIVFDTNANPNQGDHPNYVVVDFPLYSGPPWDTNNPTVRKTISMRLCMKTHSKPWPSKTIARPHPDARICLQTRLLCPEVLPTDSSICENHTQISRPVGRSRRQRENSEYVRCPHC